MRRRGYGQVFLVRIGRARKGRNRKDGERSARARKREAGRGAGETLHPVLFSEKECRQERDARGRGVPTLYSPSHRS